MVVDRVTGGKEVKELTGIGRISMSVSFKQVWYYLWFLKKCVRAYFKINYFRRVLDLYKSYEGNIVCPYNIVFLVFSIINI